MSNADSLSPSEVRSRIRAGEWQHLTTGASLGHLQANLVILPGDLAADFHAMCSANPQALPLLEATEPGVPDDLTVAPGADLRTDLPRYHVHRHGVFETEVGSLEYLWREDFVGFLLGCSFSAEHQLLKAGVRLRHLELGQGVPMFITSTECEPAGRLCGPVVVSMRPIARDQVDTAIEITSRYPLAHGAPLHVGDPRGIGITNLSDPDWGDPIEVACDEVPVFWACGVTPQTIIRAARPEISVTHAPGHMFVTDVRDETIMDCTELDLRRSPPSKTS